MMITILAQILGTFVLCSLVWYYAERYCTMVDACPRGRPTHPLQRSFLWPILMSAMMVILAVSWIKKRRERSK